MTDSTETERPVGVLLVNLGTPDAPTTPAVRRYLAEFLSDPRVVDIPAVARWLLLHGIILRVRPSQSAAAYRSIWTDAGSPLLVYSRALQEGVQQRLGDGYVVELAMRYGQPSLADAIERLLAHDLERLLILPLFPQYASATTGSVLERAFELLQQRHVVFPVETMGAFYDAPGFIDALATVTRETLAAHSPDFVLFSYHGLPERQVRKAESDTSLCDMQAPCPAVGPGNRYCYRAQCFATTRRVIERLGLDAERTGVSFQSRLGRTPWTRPYTDFELPELAKRGIKRLAIACPAFVSDCLETLEEIGIRAREQWLELGGEELFLVPGLNDHPVWMEAVTDMVRQRMAKANGDAMPVAQSPAVIRSGAL